MVLVLAGLCVAFSLLTLRWRAPVGEAAVNELLEEVSSRFERSDFVVAVGATNHDSAQVAERVGARLREAGFTAVHVVVGAPIDLRRALDEIAAAEGRVAAVVTMGQPAKWGVVENIAESYPAWDRVILVEPTQRLSSDFLKRANLLAVVDRIVVIAIIAIGMTMVIITGGIDLSVGSLIALSAVVGASAMKQLGGLTAPDWVVWAGFAAGIGCCGMVGVSTGLMVAQFKVAPFVVTLAFMMMARGLAFLITGGHSIYQVPRALPWLGQGRVLGVPNTVLLLVALYALAFVFMSFTRTGRYIYAVGGNEEAARLSGVPIRRVLVFVYTASGLAAGLGGCIQASQINTGTPNMGSMFELYVIAAVVVGGTSLSGGTGHVLGTLIGAFIIAVIQNGMNLLGIESYTQEVVLGAVLLGAVLLDKARMHGSLRWLTARG
jgi:ribose transport system permease protein